MKNRSPIELDCELAKQSSQLGSPASSQRTLSGASAAGRPDQPALARRRATAALPSRAATAWTYAICSTAGATSTRSRARCRPIWMRIRYNGNRWSAGFTQSSADRHPAAPSASPSASARRGPSGAGSLGCRLFARPVSPAGNGGGAEAEMPSPIRLN